MGNEVMPKAPGGGAMYDYLSTKGSPFPSQTGMRSSLPQGLCSPLSGTEYKKKSWVFIIRSCESTVAALDQGSLILAPPLLHLLPRGPFPLPGWLSPGPRRRTPPGSRAESGTVGCCFNLHPSLLPICIPVSSSEPLSSKTPSEALRGSLQWFELLLPSTRGMVSKLEVTAPPRGRRKIPSGFVGSRPKRCLQGRRRMCSPRPWALPTWVVAPPSVGYNQGSRAGKYFPWEECLSCSRSLGTQISNINLFSM